MIDQNTIDKVYIAGYIDGDGCFDIRRNSKKTNCRIDISSTNLDILVYFAKVFGGGVQISKKGNRPSHKPCHHWIIYGKNSLDFSLEIFPYLVEKRSQCEAYISVLQSIGKLKETAKEIFYNIKDNPQTVTKLDCEFLKCIKKSIIPSIEDFIYLAGFIDAECSFGIMSYIPKNRPNKVYKVFLACNNTCSPVFYWLMHRFGGQVHFINRNNQNSKWRDQISWRISSRSLYSILKQIIPYLRFKKPVCEKLIEFYETTLPNGGARHTQTFRDAYAIILAKRERILHEVHKLNQKGISI